MKNFSLAYDANDVGGKVAAAKAKVQETLQQRTVIGFDPVVKSKSAKKKAAAARKAAEGQA